MEYGIGFLSIVPLRAEPADQSELVSQLLYGEHFKIIAKRKKWSYIELAFDGYQGWVDNKQFISIDEDDYNSLNQTPLALSADLIDYVSCNQEQLHAIGIGSQISSCSFLNHRFEGKSIQGVQAKENLIETALTFLNTPYLWGGKTPFGIDCSGLTQMVYRLNGYNIPRDASQQAKIGEPLSFIEESEVGDLAFFDNEEGHIIHVGIIMENNYIIHAHGKVRIDRLDHLGILNIDNGRHTHKLRVIKKII